MTSEERVAKAIAYVESVPRRYEDRDWYARVQNMGRGSQGDWSGSNTAGRSFGGASWGGGRER